MPGWGGAGEWPWRAGSLAVGSGGGAGQGGEESWPEEAGGWPGRAGSASPGRAPQGRASQPAGARGAAQTQVGGDPRRPRARPQRPRPQARPSPLGWWAARGRGQRSGVAAEPCSPSAPSGESCACAAALRLLLACVRSASWLR